MSTGRDAGIDSFLFIKWGRLEVNISAGALSLEDSSPVDFPVWRKLFVVYIDPLFVFSVGVLFYRIIWSFRSNGSLFVASHVPVTRMMLLGTQLQTV